MNTLHNISYKTLLILFLPIVIVLSGCLEHTFTLRVLPDSKTELTYSARGDRFDLEDGLQLFPDSLWHTGRRVEEQDEETVHILTSELKLDDWTLINEALNWRTTPQDSIYPQQYAAVTRKAQLFGTSWRFEGTVYSRRFNEIYGDIWIYVPSECKVLFDETRKQSLAVAELEQLEDRFDLGLIQWNRARYEKMFDQVWHNWKNRSPHLTDTTAATYSIAKAGWSDDLHRYLNRLQFSEPDLVNLGWWEDLRPLFLGRMLDLTGVNVANEIITISNIIEKQYQITKDLEDEIFRYRVKLPGITTSNNADQTEGDEEWLMWEFNGRSIQNEDKVMVASSFAISTWRVAIFGGIALLVLYSLRRRLRFISLGKKKSSA